MTLTPMERVALDLLGGVARKQLPFYPRLGLALQRARMPTMPLVYLAFLDLLACIALLEGCVVLFLVVFVLPAAGLAVPLVALAIAMLAPLVLPVLVFVLGLLWPEVRAGERGTLIDNALPGALNYMAAMASSGMTPDRILASLGRQRVYGEAAEEARWVSTEVQWMGKDLLTALEEAIPRSPSARLQDVWQGMASTLGSGASLKDYLLAKAEQLHRDNAGKQRADLETLGVLAESFMVVAVAAPVFLILMLTIMGSAGPGASSSRMMLWLLVLVLLPVAQAGFGFTVRSMRGRVAA